MKISKETLTALMVDTVLSSNTTNSLGIDSIYEIDSPLYIGVYSSEPTSRPDGSSILNGDFYYNTSDKKFHLFYNGEWIEVIGGNPTPKPIILIDDPVNENQQVTGSFSICDDCTINITAQKGAISNIDYDNGTFEYIAPNITNGQNTTDTITAYAIKDGNNSDSVEKTITIKYVQPTISDDLIQNSNFYSNKQYSENIVY